MEKEILLQYQLGAQQDNTYKKKQSQNQQEICDKSPYLIKKTPQNQQHIQQIQNQIVNYNSNINSLETGTQIKKNSTIYKNQFNIIKSGQKQTIRLPEINSPHTSRNMNAFNNKLKKQLISTPLIEPDKSQNISGQQIENEYQQQKFKSSELIQLQNNQNSGQNQNQNYKIKIQKIKQQQKEYHQQNNQQNRNIKDDNSEQQYIKKMISNFDQNKEGPFGNKQLNLSSIVDYRQSQKNQAKLNEFGQKNQSKNIFNQTQNNLNVSNQQALQQILLWNNYNQHAVQIDLNNSGDQRNNQNAKVSNKIRNRNQKLQIENIKNLKVEQKQRSINNDSNNNSMIYNQNSLNNIPNSLQDQVQLDITPNGKHQYNKSMNLINTSEIQMEENKMQVEIKFAVKSRAGQHSQSIRKINQDSYIAVTRFMGDQQGFLFGIFDGHGQNGSLVSSFVKKVIHKNISQQIINTYGQQVKWNSANFQPSQLLVDSFINVHEDLKKTCTDIKFSGTTAVVIMIKNTQLWCANCGDSRAVMYSYQNGYKSKLNQQNYNSPIITQLSEDHKPSLQREKIRIQQSGGQILKSKNRNGQEIGIERVYKLNSETPGLAMTRSIGDLDGKEAGVIPDCEVQKFSINQNSQFIVIGSDGIWEFLSNQEVYDIVNPLYQQNINPKQVSEILVENAVQSWKKHDYENIDDITCIIIYLNLKQTQKIQNTSFSIDSDESPRLQQFD